MADQRTSVRNAQHGAKVVAQDIMEQSEEAKHRLGERLVIGDRIFRYCRSTATALVAGDIVTSITAANTIYGLALAAAAIGDTSVTLSGPATISTNMFAEGFFTVVSGSGAGNTYKIKSNAAGSGTTVAKLYEPLVTTFNTTNTLAKGRDSIYNGVQTASTATASMAAGTIGVAPIAVTASYYFWAQTYGPAGAKVVAGVGDAATEVHLARSTVTDNTLMIAALVSSTSTSVGTIDSELVATYIMAGRTTVGGTYELVKLTLDA